MVRSCDRTSSPATFPSRDTMGSVDSVGELGEDVVVWTGEPDRIGRQAVEDTDPAVERYYHRRCWTQKPAVLRTLKLYRLN